VQRVRHFLGAPQRRVEPHCSRIAERPFTRPMRGAAPRLLCISALFGRVQRGGERVERFRGGGQLQQGVAIIENASASSRCGSR